MFLNQSLKSRILDIEHVPVLLPIGSWDVGTENHIVHPSLGINFDLRELTRTLCYRTVQDVSLIVIVIRMFSR